ncbi:MlaD family protein [Solirubrobacter soli]|uniref:MlaD family protein n=1 Tax=Solirubrobacter soli TaxID=363832 RepID=UPI00041346F9|nr:MlaD family protein [Solirubrobacter soli]
MRGRGGGIASNPVLIGAATVLVILVAVFLSYNANKGLPFVPTYQVNAEVPSAAQLVVGNDVKIGGTRVGAVTKISPRTLRNGQVIAVLGLTLDKNAGPLPRDSTLLVRPRSALGLKYVEITRGSSQQTFADGDTITLAHAQTPVELDEFLNMFDERTRAASQANLEGFGTAFAGRGESINTAIGAFRPLLTDLIPVMRNLSDPRTGLGTFVQELSDTTAIVAPASETQASLFRNLDVTMAALRAVARPYIQDSIVGGKPALDAGIESLPRQRPFLANTEGLMRELQPGVRALRTTAPDIAGALEAGVRVLPKTPPLNKRLDSLLQEVKTFADDPLVPRGIQHTTELVNSLKPTLDYLAPTQTVCNYVTLWFRNISSLLSVGDRNGTWQRFIIVTTPQGPNNEGGPSSGPANGPTESNHLHTNPYPNTAAPGQPRECEAGNEQFLRGQTVTSNVPGTQQDKTEGYPESK